MYRLAFDKKKTLSTFFYNNEYYLVEVFSGSYPDKSFVAPTKMRRPA